MRMMCIEPGAAPADLPAEAIVCHDVRNPRQRSEVLVRKGSPLWADAIAGLVEQKVGELHFAIAESGDVAEDEAAARLAVAAAGSGVHASRPHYGQVNLSSASRGMLRVDRARLDAINTQTGVLLVTAEGDRPVEAGTTLAVVKCAPLFLSEAIVAAVHQIAGNGGVVCVEPFQAQRIGFLAPRERLRAGAFDRARGALSDALGWYSSTLEPVIGTEATREAIADGFARVGASGVDLIFAAGASGTDPLDVVFEGLRRAGGDVLQMGIPAEPGTACWIGQLGSVAVLGLASCELFGKPGALDLLLPRLLTGEPLSIEMVRGLAYGGLLNGPSRLAAYHTPSD